MHTSDDFRHAVSRLTEGQQVELQLSRGAARLSVSVSCAPAPQEQTEGLRSEYGQINLSDHTRLRSIVTRTNDESGAHARAVVLFLPGYSLTSCDYARSPEWPVRRWVEQLAREGFVIVRVERRGCGESDACVDSTGAEVEVSFEQELADWEQAHRQLSSALVDEHGAPLSWVVYGHSLGGLQAPLLAPKINARAIAVWGSGIDTWSEYSDALLRRRMRFDNCSESEIEAAVRAQQHLFASVLLGGQSLQSWLQGPSTLTRWSEWLGVDEYEQIHGRNVHYWRQVYRCECAAPLERWQRPLLALRGDSDCLTFAHEHERIAQTAPLGRYVSIAQVDHDYTTQASMLASHRKQQVGTYDRSAVDVLAKWLNELVMT